MSEEETIISTLDGWELFRFHQIGGTGLTHKQRRTLKEKLSETRSELNVPKPLPFVEAIRYTVAVGTTRHNRGRGEEAWQNRMRAYAAGRRLRARLSRVDWNDGRVKRGKGEAA